MADLRSGRIGKVTFDEHGQAVRRQDSRFGQRDLFQARIGFEHVRLIAPIEPVTRHAVSIVGCSAMVFQNGFGHDSSPSESFTAEVAEITEKPNGPCGERLHVEANGIRPGRPPVAPTCQGSASGETGQVLCGLRELCGDPASVTRPKACWHRHQRVCRDIREKTSRAPSPNLRAW